MVSVGIGFFAGSEARWRWRQQYSHALTKRAIYYDIPLYQTSLNLPECGRKTGGLATRHCPSVRMQLPFWREADGQTLAFSGAPP